MFSKLVRTLTLFTTLLVLNTAIIAISQAANLIIEENRLSFTVETLEESGVIAFPEFKGIEYPAVVYFEEGFFKGITTIHLSISTENIDYEKSQSPYTKESYLSPSITVSFPASALAALPENPTFPVDTAFSAYSMRTWSHVEIPKEREDFYISDGYLTRFFFPEGAEKPFKDKIMGLYDGEESGATITLDFLRNLYYPYPDTTMITFQSQVIRTEVEKPLQER